MIRAASLVLAGLLTLVACTAVGVVAPSAAPAASTTVPGASTFDADRALAHLRYLADPGRGGRYSGSAGYRDAATYVADRFREIGLEPLGDDGTYFQHFPMPNVELAGKPVLRRESPDPKDYHHRVDFTESVGARAGSGSAAGPVVVVGGAARAGTQNDFAGVQTRGKIALVTGPASGNYVEAAYREGATAVLVVGDASIRYSYLPRFEMSTIPVMVITAAAADELLGPSGKRTSDVRSAVQARRADPNAPAPAFDLATTRMSVSVPLTAVHDVDGINVVGVLRASDPEGAKRAVLVGGHLDGIGTDPDGLVFSAANDNASGPAITIEVARALAARRSELHHSVAFVAFAGEEEGLLGSEAYASRMAAIPGRVESLIAMLNLDVIGCCGERLGVSNESPTLQQEIRAVAARLNVPVTTFGGGSDQSSFARRRVPAALIAWERPILHTKDDTIALIERWRIKDAGDVVTETAREVATKD